MKFRCLAACVCLVLTGLSACAANETAAPVKAGGLSCFSISPPNPKPGEKLENVPSCNDLCAAQDAACTGIASPINPPQRCEDQAQWDTCRCCTVTP